MSEKNVKKIYPRTRNWITHKDSNLAASYLVIECPFNFMWLQKNHQQHSQQKWIKFTYIFLHHIRAMFSHHLHVILYEHSILLLSTFQHGVDSNVRTSSTNTSTVMKQTNKRSQKKNDHVVKRKKKFSRPAILNSSAAQTRWMLSTLHYTCSTNFLSHWGKRRFSHLKNYLLHYF